MMLLYLLVCLLSYGHPSPRVSSEVFFKANGVDPRWTLEVADDRIVFESDQPGYARLTMPYAAPVRMGSSGLRQYTLKSDAAEIVIELAQMLCQNEHSHERFPYSVYVSVKRDIDTSFFRFEGCGLYIPDYRLQHTWELVSIRGMPVTAADFNDTIPEIEINSKGGSFKGYSGCNPMSGRLYYEKDLLRFTDFVKMKIKCDPAGNKEADFISALQFTTNYGFRQDTLVLSYPGKELLRLKKR